jgi:threonine dehydratase
VIPLGEIREAAARIGRHVHRTPVFPTAQLSARTGVRLVLKCESFQKTGSFKARGALN